MTKAKKNPAPTKPKVPKEEKEQVRARVAAGHFETLGSDEHGRVRLIQGTAESAIQYDYDPRKATVVRVRNIDPLKGILSLTHKQRAAGNRYRADFELAVREGLKAASFDERVSNGCASTTVPARLIDNHAVMSAARKAVGYPEIIRVLDYVCGQCMTIKEVAKRENVVRDIPAQLLRMGLERLVIHYSSQPASRHG